MNAKRVAMIPPPPLPILADKYLSGTISSGKSWLRPIHLEPTEEGGMVTTPVEFFGVKGEPKDKGEEDATVDGQLTAEQPRRGARKTKPAKKRNTDEPLDALSKELYGRLSARRLTLASSESVPAYVIANNSVLEGLARKRPIDEKGLLTIRGIGPVKQEKYGAHWLEVITKFCAERDIGPSEQTEESRELTTSKLRARRRKIVTADKGSGSPPSSPTFGSPLVRTPQLHTGLSFQLEGTNLESQGSIDGSEDENAEVIDEEEYSGEDQDHFEEGEEDGESQEHFVTPAESSSQLKRKRDMSGHRYREESSSLKRRSASPCVRESPALPLPQPPLSPRSKMFQNKLVAFTRLVARTIGLDPLDPLLSEDTLRHIVMNPPKTSDELQRIPGITKLVGACVVAEKDLLKNIVKFAPVRY
ncbi:hypothetical protein BCR34DRAFT_628717 [Clohesyomyces aquaticus]|uniref:HRDC domain-containing protein n=1 Tax=Clohesyomyces aquaticus TaxID=1231657 RepID=A0A1Y1YG27_9PLEO|nr:hypothetical protein BCR34DRAFT_628717 [Clohesyomyces aquaticus]